MPSRTVTVVEGPTSPSGGQLPAIMSSLPREPGAAFGPSWFLHRFGANALLPGTLLGGRYRVVRRLGKGGEGEIFVGRDEFQRRNVAIKFQLPRTFESTDTYASNGRRLESELDRLRFMAHVPGIPEVFDDGRYGPTGRRYIVMELIDGTTIASWIASHQPVPSASAISVVAQLCETLCRVHAQHVHRDVTPKNTMIQPDGRVRLLDVGISISVGTANELPCGSPGYAAPEQYDAAAVMTPRVDVFALGVMLFEMVLGRLPYDGLEHPLDAEAAPFPPGFRAGMPKALRSLALAMVAIDPRQRPESVATVSQYLRPMLPPPGTPAAPKATRPDPTAWYRHRTPGS